MSSQPIVVAQPVVVHVLCGWCGDMLWEAHWLVVQHNNAKQMQKYCTTHNTDAVAYATHSGSYSTECKKEVHQLHTGTHWYTTITTVHNIHSGAQHIHDTETFRLPERQVASTMISVLILLV